MADKKEIVVLGAGVIGLQTALTLLENGFNVTIVAKHWPGDDDINYTSMKAGAHWRSHASPDDTLSQSFDTETYHHWKSLHDRGLKPSETGLMLIPSIYIYDVATPAATSPWWSSMVANFRILPESELPPGARLGTVYDSFCINPHRYLDFLLGQLGDLGVKTITAEVETLEEVFELPGVEDGVVGVVNCSGLAAKELCNDEKVFPTRGQTILVRGEADTVKIRVGLEGWTAYVVRRPGVGTILGGSYQEGDWNEHVDEELSEKILERCAVIAPELLVDGKFDIISQQVGRRPSRRGGPRIEVEWIQHEGSRKFICHHYGHAGAGYQNSYGSARAVLRLIQHALGV